MRIKSSYSAKKKSKIQLFFVVFKRCFIPECDNIENYSYATQWLQNAIPFDHGKPSKCHRFAEMPVDSNISQRISWGDKYTEDSPQTCKETQFNRSKIIACADDGLIYRTNELTVVNEVKEWDIICIIIT